MVAGGKVALEVPVAVELNVVSCDVVFMGCYSLPMSFSILAWNVRGLGRLDKRRIVKDIVQSSSMELLVLVESKLKSLPRTFLRQVCHFPLVDGICLHSKGAAGGIWVIWDSSKIEIINSWVKEFSVSVLGRMRNIEEAWLLSGVYGPCLSEWKPAFLRVVWFKGFMDRPLGASVATSMKSCVLRKG